MPLKVTMVNADPLGEEINVMFKVRGLELFFVFCLLGFVGARCIWFGFETGSLYNPGYPRTCYVDQTGIELKQLSPHFHLLSAGIKGVHHYHQETSEL